MPDTLFPVYFNLTYGCLEGQVILLIATLILTIVNQHPYHHQHRHHHHHPYQHQHRHTFASLNIIIIRCSATIGLQCPMSYSLARCNYIPVMSMVMVMVA